MTATITSTLRVLVIDDHRSYAEALSLAIPSVGLRVHRLGARRGRPIQKVLAERPDVVVIDRAVLPLVDGEGIRRILVADPKVKLVMITGHADSGLRKLAALAGAPAFLAKEKPRSPRSSRPCA